MTLMNQDYHHRQHYHDIWDIKYGARGTHTYILMNDTRTIDLTCTLLYYFLKKKDHFISN